MLASMVRQSARRDLRETNCGVKDRLKRRIILTIF